MEASSVPARAVSDPLYAAPHLKRREFKVPLDEQKKLLKTLDPRTDFEASRLKRYLAMPDLTRTPGSPLNEMVKRIMALPDFAGFDVIETPEVVPARESFDLFNFPKDHPARSRSDTYYLDDTHIFRTHTTIMWYYYLQLPEVKARLARGESVGTLSFGKVYRKDEIDRKHMNIFHQIDGWFLCRKDERKIGMKELQDVLAAIAKAIYGPNIKYRFNPDTFPYTDPSLEMEVDFNSVTGAANGAKNAEPNWVEVLGSGVVRADVLDNLGVDSKQWNGWAFGFGLERLALLSMELPDIRLLWSTDPRVTKQLTLGQKYKEVSKYPPITRDISFVVPARFVPNNYFDLIRDIGGELVEEVSLLDKYENAEKFGAGNVSYTYRIIYRSPERTLTTEEIEPLQEKIVEETKKQFGAAVR
jgi:phenylalanyl-tRNA synthetase alpha chain